MKYSLITLERILKVTTGSRAQSSLRPSWMKPHTERNESKATSGPSNRSFHYEKTKEMDVGMIGRDTGCVGGYEASYGNDRYSTVFAGRFYEDE